MSQVTCPECSGPASNPIGFMVVCPRCDGQVQAAKPETVTIKVPGGTAFNPNGDLYMEVARATAHGMEYKTVKVTDGKAVIPPSTPGPISAVANPPLPKLYKADLLVPGHRPFGLQRSKPLSTPPSQQLSEKLRKALLKFQSNIGPVPHKNWGAEHGDCANAGFKLRMRSAMGYLHDASHELQGDASVFQGRSERAWVKRSAAYWPIYWAGQSSEEMRIGISDAGYMMAHDYLKLEGFHKLMAWRKEQGLEPRYQTLLAGPHLVNDDALGIWRYAGDGVMCCLVRCWVGVLSYVEPRQ